ncbi:hypothetical protein [Streptomyces sp. NPDC058653]|uniref:hypothetical protein n=1 Tax=Streptomyces sp. NPDC058653 TaxID=3346576 RepID=UPI003668761D
MKARETLFEVACDDMPVTSGEVNDAIDAFARELTAKVRALHRPVEHAGRTICAECSAWDGQSIDNSPVAYDQCPTLRALNNPEA